MPLKTAITSVPINPLLQTRWSPRAFDPSKPVVREDLLALMEAARWAASCFNDQPWRFVICDKTTNEAAWQRALDTLADKNRRWAKNAPVLILAVAMEHFGHNGQPNRWAMYDTGAASANLCLQASALGLCTHQMGGFNAELARETFKLPDNCFPMAMIAVGYPADADLLDDDFKATELAPRSRAKLEEKFYSGKWDNGFD